MWIEFNPNPKVARVGDCVVRAVSKVTDQDWIKTYIDLSLYGLIHCDILSANHVWGAYLKDKGFKRYLIPDSCPACYTVEDFCNDHPKGTYLLAISGHAVACCDGDHFDSWNSKDEVPVFYWTKEGE